ncbi:uncharacterized protein LOC109861902 [Pseudomyrmex gracilis]|uniref:uncharacterized protein LOC109861902 n=1 Tax=Pseudomyrmex gracilis TaxID=219809 RepID=UPI000995696C|nr:uncharacterized protein LOC109861902 [Pseudomyrmex gracilis]
MQRNNGSAKNNIGFIKFIIKNNVLSVFVYEYKKERKMNQNNPSTSFEGKPRNRSHSKVDLEVESDKTKQHNHDVPIQDKKTNEQQTTKNILDFPDEVLFRIFKNVDLNDLNNLRLCCTRFARLAADKLLWSLDYRKTPIFPSRMEPYKTFLKPLTYSLAIRGDFKHGNKNILPPYFFFKLLKICRMLSKLIIEEYYIPTKWISEVFFPTKFFPKEFLPQFCTNPWQFIKIGLGYVRDVNNS